MTLTMGAPNNSKYTIDDIIDNLKNEDLDSNPKNKKKKKKKSKTTKPREDSTDELGNTLELDRIELTRKKDYMRYRKSHLKKGAIMPIYSNWKEQDGLIGYAKLNKRVSKDSEEYPFERASVGSGRIKEPDLVIYRFQRWNITFVDPLDYNSEISQQDRWKYLSQKGFTTNWNISYFEAVDSNYIS